MTKATTASRLPEVARRRSAHVAARPDRPHDALRRFEQRLIIACRPGHGVAVLLNIYADSADRARAAAKAHN
jgi:hypothetical protein